MSRTVIIGGGIVGAATAWQLAKRGDPPTIFDRHDPGRATAAGAGISYVPPIGPTGDAPLTLAARANATHLELARQLERELDIDEVGVERRPIFKIAHGEERGTVDQAWEWISTAVRDSAHLDPDDVSRVDADAVADRMPHVAEAGGGIRFDTGLRIDGRTVTDALCRAARKAGARFHEDDVTGIRLDEQSVVGVVARDRGVVEVDRVVIAGGAWSGQFATDLGVEVPVHPQRGQIMHLRDVDGDTASWPMVSTFDGTYLVPWDNGHVAVGTTHEDVGFDARTTVDGVDELTSRAMALLPALGDATFDEVRVGLRPQSADGTPILGPLPGVDGAYVATGHGGGGLQRGPISGQLLAELLTDGDPTLPLEAFSPARFTRQ